MIANIGDRRELRVLRFAAARTSPRRDEMDRVSTAATPSAIWAAACCCVVNLPGFCRRDSFGLPDTVAAIKLSFVSVGGLVAALFDCRCSAACREPPPALEPDETPRRQRDARGFRPRLGHASTSCAAIGRRS